MIKSILFFTLIIGFAVSCLAADIDLNWDVSDGAVGYKVYQSVDTGQTWDEVGDVVACTTPLVVPDSGLVLFRVSAYNNQGEVIRCDAGAWYNGDWTPPAQPTGTGIQ